MRSYRRTPSRARSKNDGSFWLSFSDLMSSLVLIIILVMFYIIYQYFNLAEINQAEIARREYQLEVAQTELETQQSKLSDAEKQMIAQQILLDAREKELTSTQEILEAQKSELESTQSQLSEKEIEIATQQAQLYALSEQLDLQRSQLNTQQSQLNTQQQQIDDQKSQLSTQQAQLEDAQAQLLVQQNQLVSQQNQLAVQQGQLADQQSKIDTQQAQLDNQQQQIEQLVGMKTRIITSLSAALKDNGISATVDPVNGSIALESDVLFGSGQYKLTTAGKDFVDQFLPVYLDVLFSEEYKPYVAEIIVEGHTDSDGGYLSNLELSQQRALAVASYVLGDDCHTVRKAVKSDLRQVVTVNGRSYSDRIMNEHGREDKDASRRVVFKFRLTDEQMIQQLRQILEHQ